MDKVKIFWLEISHLTSNHAAEVALPATAYELLDAFEKARITDRQDMSVEILAVNWTICRSLLIPAQALMR